MITEQLPADWRERKTERQRKFLSECKDAQDNIAKASLFTGGHEFRRVSPVCFDRAKFEQP